MQLLAELFGTQALAPVEYTDTVWNHEDWSRGCYGAYMPPGLLSEQGAHLRQAVGPMFFAGTETASRWTGYVEGAIRAGERAASELRAALEQ